MLSDEEKKAIESFKEENNNDLIRFDDFNSYTQFKVKRDKLIIDLIEKQSKEIEELKEERKKYIIRMTDEQYTKVIELVECDINKKWKDKIKAKIEEMDKIIEDSRNKVFKHPHTLIEASIVKYEMQSLLEKE